MSARIYLEVKRTTMQLADDLRFALLRVLAPDCICASCECRFDISALEIDHVDGRSWEANRLGRLQRARRYWVEFLSGVRLRAVCRSCNAITGGGRRYQYDRKENAA